MLAMMAVIVDYTFNMCFSLSIFYRRSHRTQGNLPSYSLSWQVWVR